MSLPLSPLDESSGDSYRRIARNTSVRRSKRRHGPITHIRVVLNDQLKCLDTKLEAQIAMVTELQDFYRKRAEIELEYSRSLSRLFRQAMDRDKAEKQKRETWPLFSTYKCLQVLLTMTKKQSKDHQVFGSICANEMVGRLGEIIDNTVRIYKKCRDIGSESHDNIMQVLNSLQATMKMYHGDQSESKHSEVKLKSVEHQKAKLEQQILGKTGTLSSRKLKNLDRQLQKKSQKYSENKFKALQSRNEYLLNIDASNAAINKYFSDDISDLIDCMDFGYHNSVGRAMMMQLSVEEEMRASNDAAIDLINNCIGNLDALADKQRFLEINNSLFMLPRKFEFLPFKNDEVKQISAQPSVQEQLLSEQEVITNRISQLRLEIDETWKSLETTEKFLMDMINVPDFEVSNYFRDEQYTSQKSVEAGKKKTSRYESENFYLQKFRDYTLSCNRQARLMSKLTSLQKALGDSDVSANSLLHSRPPLVPPKPVKRRIGRVPVVGQPKLFGGSLEEYMDITGQEIPTVIKSSIRVIARHGMQHQGIFRVSGSQVEINDFKSKFEKGDDPMMDIVDACDINSVAGVLKLYFRELREPLFPLHLFDELLSCSKVEDLQERKDKIRELIDTLPQSVIIVMRYLFGFLNHLSEFAEENMMDPCNLAICFGPTLLPIPPDRDQVVYQNSVNEVVKTIIQYPDDIFILDYGDKYDRAIAGHRVKDIQDIEADENSSAPSDEDPELQEATALYDFEARTERELSFKKGDQILIYNRASSDWWEGLCNNREGLIPDKYIALKSPSYEDKKSHSSEDEKLGTHSSSMTSSVSVASPPEDAQLESVDNVDDSVDIRETDIVSVDSLSLSSPPLSPMSLSAESLEGQLEHIPEVTVSETGTSDHQPQQEVVPELNPVELSVDIDNALAEVMSGLKSLEIHNDKRLSLPIVKTKQVPKHTPDLVLDLPEDGSDSPPSVEVDQTDSPILSVAETFAKSNQSTLKKSVQNPRSPDVNGDGGSYRQTTDISQFSQIHKNRFSLSEELREDPIFEMRRCSSTTATIQARKALLEQKLNPGLHSPPTALIKPLDISAVEKPKVKVKPVVMKKPIRSPDSPLAEQPLNISRDNNSK